MSQIDMSAQAISQRLKRVAQMRKLCLKLSKAGKQNLESIDSRQSRYKKNGSIRRL